MKLSKFYFILLISLLFNFNVFASEPWFGAEWTFSNENIINDARNLGGSDDRELLRDKWIEKIKEKCSECSIYHYTVTLPNGHWFKITKDPWVLEVNASPMTLEDIRENKTTLQSLVWDAAKEVGLTPHYRVGGGHIHLDSEGHFQEDRNLFRNFIVDIFNHPELFMGAFSLDYLNAPPMALIGQESILKFSAMLNEFENRDMSLTEFAYGTMQAYRLSKDFGTTRTADLKYQAVNLNHSETIEIRGFRPQVSAEHFELIAEILTARIERLKKLDGLIPYQPKDYNDKVATTLVDRMEIYETRIAPNEILDVLIKYLSSSGIDPLRYAPYVTEELQSSLQGSVADYITNKKFESELAADVLIIKEDLRQCIDFLNSAGFSF